MFRNLTGLVLAQNILAAWEAVKIIRSLRTKVDKAKTVLFVLIAGVMAVAPEKRKVLLYKSSLCPCAVLTSSLKTAIDATQRHVKCTSNTMTCSRFDGLLRWLLIWKGKADVCSWCPPQLNFSIAIDTNLSTVSIEWQPTYIRPE